MKEKMVDLVEDIGLGINMEQLAQKSTIENNKDEKKSEKHESK